MPDSFIILRDNSVLVILRGFKSPLPDWVRVLDWYAKEYAIERDKLKGIWIHSIDVSDMKFEDFK